MDINITPRSTRDKRKIYYTLEWGKKAGERIATGIFIYTSPANDLQQLHNTEALRSLEIRRAQMLLDWMAVGTRTLPSHRYQLNFLDYYSQYVKENSTPGNRHLEGSYKHFRQFVQNAVLSPLDVTEDLSIRFRKYLLNHLNGETPANYFARYKRVIKSATACGYFKVNPSLNVAAKPNRNKRRKNSLEVEEYLQLLRTPALNKNVRDAFIFCCYTGLRWCDVKLLRWRHIRDHSIVLSLVQKKTFVEHRIELHPIARAILEKRKPTFDNCPFEKRIFYLPSADGANKVLGQWTKNAHIEKHITWSCARLSFSILLQDSNVDAATVALLLGHTSTKYVNEVYRRYRPKNQFSAVSKLPQNPALEGHNCRPPLFLVRKFLS